MIEHHERRKPEFWIKGVLSEAFASHPVLTIFVILAFIGGAIAGANIGLTMGGAMTFIIASLTGAVGGVIIIFILWVILMAIGLAG